MKTILGEGKLRLINPAKVDIRKGPFHPSHSRAGTYEAEELRYGNGDGRSPRERRKTLHKIR